MPSSPFPFPDLELDTILVDSSDAVRHLGSL